MRRVVLVQWSIRAEREEGRLGTKFGYPVQWFLLRAELQDEGGNGKGGIQ